MNDEKYLEALRVEQGRREGQLRDEELLHEANLNQINQEYKSGGGHGAAVAGVIITLVLGIAAWMYFV